jgi:hypothetical protein
METTLKSISAQISSKLVSYIIVLSVKLFAHFSTPALIKE